MEQSHDKAKIQPPRLHGIADVGKGTYRLVLPPMINFGGKETVENFVKGFV